LSWSALPLLQRQPLVIYPCPSPRRRFTWCTPVSYEVMPPGSLATHRLLAEQLVSTPIIADTLPASVRLFHDAMVLLTRDLFVASISRGFD